MSDILIKLDNHLSKEEHYKLELFRIKFLEFWSNWESLKKSGLKLGGGFTNEGSGKVSGPGCGIEHHRLKGLYMDYRFFHAKKEPTHFFRITNLISRSCNDKRLREAISIERDNWNQVGFLQEWHGIKTEMLINSMFNGNLFHSSEESRNKITEINNSMSDDLAHHVLTYCVYNRMLSLRNINWIISPLKYENQYIKLPSRYA